MILVDTSVGIDHLRSADADLTLLLERNDVVTHGVVMGELALGDWHDTRLVSGSAGSRGPGRLANRSNL